MAVADKLLEKPNWKDPTLDLIRDRGGRHEQRYIKELRAEDRDIVDLSSLKALPDYADQQARTVDAMKSGADVIYQGTFFDGRWVGHPDFLLRVPVLSHLSTQRYSQGEAATSGLGHDWIYEIADTKLAHEAKATALIQICSYVDQIERIQGLA